MHNNNNNSIVIANLHILLTHQVCAHVHKLIRF